jgi:hypothetical protein
MTSAFEGILNALQKRDLITPYFEAAVLSDNWPESYNIKIDSGPYYGKGDGYFHPSTHPLMGERELYYRFHPDTRDKMLLERRSLQGEMTLAMGSALHGVLQTQMEMADLITLEDIEVEYVNHDHHVRGRIDWIVNHPNGTRIVTEFKTRTHYKFSKQMEPELSWLAQLNLGMDSQDCDLGVLLMMESGWPYNLREFRVERDHNLLDQIYTKFDRVRQAIADNEPPRHCCELGSHEMKACPARYECWLKT